MDETLKISIEEVLECYNVEDSEKVAEKILDAAVRSMKCAKQGKLRRIDVRPYTDTTAQSMVCALQRLHECGVNHGDICSGNIMTRSEPEDEDPIAVLGDMDSALLADEIAFRQFASKSLDLDLDEEPCDDIDGLLCVGSYVKDQFGQVHFFNRFSN